MESFDWPDRHGVDTATLKLLIAVLHNSPRDAEVPAVAGFWTTWTNPLYQLRILDALLSLPSDTFNFVSLPGRRVVTVDDVASASPTIKSLAANVQGHTWNSLDLFEVLVRLGDSESADIRNSVRDMLDKAVKISADIVHMGLLQVPVSLYFRMRSSVLLRLILICPFSDHGTQSRTNTVKSCWLCSWQDTQIISWCSCVYGKLSHLT